MSGILYEILAQSAFILCATYQVISHPERALYHLRLALVFLRCSETLSNKIY